MRSKHRYSPPRRRALLLLVTGAAACTSGGGSNGPDANWKRLDDIAYVLPRELPDGWAVRVATERPGKASTDFDTRADIYANAARTRFLVLSATGTFPENVTRPTSLKVRGKPAKLIDDDADSLGYFFGYTVADAVGDDFRQFGPAWIDGKVALSVLEVAAAPDRQFAIKVAEDFDASDDLDFDVPRSVTQAGFKYLASAGDIETVPDYSVSWAPRDVVGATRRAAIDAGEAGPTLSLNVGGVFYGQILQGRTVSQAKVSQEADGWLKIEFTIDGSSVRLRGRGVDEAQLRRTARSLETHDRAAWRKALGDRLLVDEFER